MRYRSTLSGGVRVFAVAGTNTVSFGIHADQMARSGLLGFAIERVDLAKNERYYLNGFKVFPSIVPQPDEDTYVSSYVHPIQSLVWDDFTAEPAHDYTYVFHPLAGTPKNLDRSRPSVSIDIKTEPLQGETHDVFFNRGVASSQAYARKFLNLSPSDQPSQRKRREALQWLSRDLDDAMLRFIRTARRGDAIRGCFYEFSYGPVLAALAAAVKRGVDVKLVVDCKVNEHTVNEKQPDGTRKPVFYESNPRLKNLAAITAAELPPTAITRREARRAAIAHNKFMVLLTGNPQAPRQIWTGSTNLTDGGIHGQANVGHWIRDATTAAKFHKYWELLASDPGGRRGDTQSVVRARNSEFYEGVDVMSPTPKREAIPPGVTPLFSPRRGSGPLELYVELLDEANDLACITFAFTVPDLFKAALKQNSSDGPLCFLLLEKEDRPAAQNSTKPFIRLNAKNNVYMASGAELRTTLGQWVVETDTRKLGLNQHVAFIHCKFLLHDPLGDDPIVVTGSANFSTASTSENDENMVIVRGDRRVADIYFTEFNRLFNHYYFRSIAERSTPTETLRGLHLVEDDSWLEKYQPGTLRSKRLECFVQMAL